MAHKNKKKNKNGPVTLCRGKVLLVHENEQIPAEGVEMHFRVAGDGGLVQDQDLYVSLVTRDQRVENNRTVKVKKYQLRNENKEFINEINLETAWGWNFTPSAAVAYQARIPFLTPNKKFVAWFGKFTSGSDTMTLQFVPVDSFPQKLLQNPSSDAMKLRLEQNEITVGEVEELIEKSAANTTPKNGADKLELGEGWRIACAVHTIANSTTNYGMRITLRDANNQAIHLYLQDKDAGSNANGNRALDKSLWRGDEKKDFHFVIGEVEYTRREK